MKNQMTLRYPDVPGSVNVDTSRAAASSVDAISLRTKVLVEIAGHHTHGLTCDQVEVLCGLRHQTASARCRELVMKGYIVQTEQKRATRSGRNARVYVAKAFA